MKNQTSLTKSIFIFILVAAFLVYEMAVQVSPSVMVDDLMRDLQVDAVGIGFTSGIYFYTYTFMQIPAGLFFDRFALRPVIIIPILLCALGAYLFGIATTLPIAATGRLFMGAGSAFAFIAVLVVAGDLFPSRYFAFLAGITQLLAAIGAMSGEAPLVSLMDYMQGWRSTMMMIAMTGVILAVLIFLFARYPKRINHSKETSRNVLMSLREIVGSSQTWFIAFYACLLWAPMTMFASLWGVPYLAKAQHLSQTAAANYLSAMWWGVGLASPLLGWWSDRIGRRRFPLNLSCMVGLVASVAILTLSNLSKPFLIMLLFLIGAACAGQLLSFAVARENNLRANHAAAIGFNNMAVVISGAIFQPLAAYLIHWHWQGAMENGIPLYSDQDYLMGAILLPICFLLGLVFSGFFIRETYCQQKMELS